jgi:outer membrane protein assembly factor BamB
MPPSASRTRIDFNMTPSTTNLSAKISSGLLSLLSVFALGLTQAAPAPNPSAVLAPDWPQFHGPHRDSICTETGLLQEWPAQGPPLLWKCTGLGNGYATVAIANGRLFTTGDRKLAEETNRSQYVMAFDLGTRSNLWITRIGLPGQNGACSTPTVDGSLLYAISGDGNLVCVETGAGKEIWRKSMTRDFDGKVMEQWKYSESPLVDGDKVICTPGGKDATMVALNKRTGELIWKCPRPSIARQENKPGAGYGSIVVAEVEGLKHYIAVTGVGAMGVAADTGKLLWSHNRIANYTANIPTPVVRSNCVFLIAGYETGANLLTLTRAGDLLNAEEVYYLGRSKMGQSGFINCHGGVVLVGDYVYGAHGDHGPPGNPTCVQFSTGNIMWKEKPPTKPGSASVLYADQRIIWRYADGTVFLVEPSPQEFRIKGQFKAAVNMGDAWAHPVIHGGMLYLRSQDTLMCYDVRAKE